MAREQNTSAMLQVTVPSRNFDLNYDDDDDDIMSKQSCSYEFLWQNAQTKCRWFSATNISVLTHKLEEKLQHVEQCSHLQLAVNNFNAYFALISIGHA
jgi:hypothetical protein